MSDLIKKLRLLDEGKALYESILVAEVIAEIYDRAKGEDGDIIKTIGVDYSEDGGYYLPRLNTLITEDWDDLSINDYLFESTYDTLQNEIDDYEAWYKLLLKVSGSDDYDLSMEFILDYLSKKEELIQEFESKLTIK